MTSVWKGSVCRLRQPELQYELLSRGFDAPMSVYALHNSVWSVPHMEAEKSFSVAPHTIPFADDRETVKRHIEELTDILKLFTGDIADKGFLRAKSLWTHADSRCRRMQEQFRSIEMFDLHNMTLIVKWGSDGSRRQSPYKRAFQQPSSDDDASQSRGNMSNEENGDECCELESVSLLVQYSRQREEQREKQYEEHSVAAVVGVCDIFRFGLALYLTQTLYMVSRNEGAKRKSQLVDIILCRFNPNYLSPKMLLKRAGAPYR
ncbi:hypothetical protein FQA39_LY13361 [Lamprigera yunnana]|nr:hypothetical protein FQA39_LY13361 [Lamprigera yunnana]